MKNDNKRSGVIVCGAGGRMGGRIIHAIQNSAGVKLVAGVEIKGHPIFEKGIAQYVGIPDIDVPIVDDLDKIVYLGDVIVDFTTPDASLLHLETAMKGGKAMVVGTTGLTTNHKRVFADAGKQIPVCLSPNMSVGVNLLFALAEKVAKVLGPEYEPEIVEIHHHLKKDAPSGTAIQLSNIIAGSRGWDLESSKVFGREGMVGERKSREIGIHAVRTGDVVGEHTIIFGGPSERIELVHRAHSRDIFAYGAVKAVLFVAKAPPGLYEMKDVLGLDI